MAHRGGQLRPLGERHGGAGGGFNLCRVVENTGRNFGARAHENSGGCVLRRPCTASLGHVPVGVTNCGCGRCLAQHGGRGDPRKGGLHGSVFDTLSTCSILFQRFFACGRWSLLFPRLTAISSRATKPYLNLPHPLRSRIPAVWTPPSMQGETVLASTRTRTPSWTGVTPPTPSRIARGAFRAATTRPWSTGDRGLTT